MKETVQHAHTPSARLYTRLDVLERGDNMVSGLGDTMLATLSSRQCSSLMPLETARVDIECSIFAFPRPPPILNLDLGQIQFQIQLNLELGQIQKGGSGQP